MSWILALISGSLLAKDYIKEKRRPVIPAENWRNSDLMREDDLNPCISPAQVMKNLENGKYYLPDVPPNAVIEDKEAYEKDRRHYDFCTVYKFAEQGKYKKKPKEIVKEKIIAADYEGHISRKDKPASDCVFVYIAEYPFQGLRVHRIDSIEPCKYDNRFNFVYDKKFNETYAIIKADEMEDRYYASCTKFVLDRIQGDKKTRDKYYWNALRNSRICR